MNVSLSASAAGASTGESFAAEDENLTIWSDNETALFLSIWRRPDVQTALRQYTRKRPIWKKVSLELANEGYRRNAEQCKSKMHNLMTSYRRVKKGLDSEARCKFFPLIDEVMTSVEFERPSPTSAGSSSATTVPSLSFLSTSSPASSTANASSASASSVAGVGRQSNEDSGSATGISDGRGGRVHRLPVGYRDERSEEVVGVSDGPSPGSSTHSDASNGTRPSPHPLSVVPWRLAGGRGSRLDTSGAVSAAAVMAHVQRSWTGDDARPPSTKRFCNWDNADSVYTVDADDADRCTMSAFNERCSPSSDSHQANNNNNNNSNNNNVEPRDLRVTERASPLPVVPPAARVPPTRSPPPAGLMSSGMYAIEAHRLLAERARHLFGVVPQTALPPAPLETGANGWHDSGPPATSTALPDGGSISAMRQRLNSSGPSLSSTGQEHGTASCLARMEGLLQEMVDLQRAYILSEERRRREYMEREEIWQEQNREFLLQLVHTLNNTH